jgi:hypothetical protein
VKLTCRPKPGPRFEKKNSLSVEKLGVRHESAVEVDEKNMWEKRKKIGEKGRRGRGNICRCTEEDVQIG